MTNIFWEVDKLISNNDGLVTQVNCSINAEDGEDFAKFDLRIPLQQGDSFVPYEQLTKEQVLDWVRSFLGVEFFEQHNQIVMDLLTEKKITKLPWA
jgi:hypothetical protein